jgi:hypothetical protein
MNGMLARFAVPMGHARRNITSREAFCLQGNPNASREVTAMTKTMTALAAAATMAVAAVAVPQSAQARWGGHWHGGWGGGAVLGGLAAGAIIGGALAGPYYYGGGPYYGYYGGPYAYGHCWNERVATPYGWRWHRVCE